MNEQQVKAKPIAFIIGLGLLTFLIYAPTIGYDFLNWDDIRILKSHPERYDHDSVSAAFKTIVLTDYPREEPLILRDLSWALDAALFGFENPAGYHFTNALFQAFVVMLLFGFWFRMSQGRLLFAGLATFLFLWSAITIEPVTWIMGRKDLMSAFFLLTGLHFYISFVDGKKPGLNYTLSLLALIAAYLSKINSLVFPALLFFTALCRPYFFQEDSRPDWKVFTSTAVKKLLPCLPHLAAAIFVFIWYRARLREFGFQGNTPDFNSLFVLNPESWLLYLKNWFFPWDLSLIYSEPAIRSSYPLSAYILSTTTILVLLGWVITNIVKKQWVSLFFIGALAVTLLPYQNLVSNNIWFADRYFYISAIFLAGAVAYFVEQIRLGEQKTAKIVTAALLVVTLTFNAVERFRYQPKWESPDRLWSHLIQQDNPHYFSFTNLITDLLTQAQESTDPKNRELILKTILYVAQSGIDHLSSFPNRDRDIGSMYYYQGVAMQMGGTDPIHYLERFQKSQELNPDRIEVYWKLAEAHLDRYRFAEEADKPGLRQAAKDAVLKFKEVAGDQAKTKRTLSILKTRYTSMTGEVLP